LSFWDLFITRKLSHVLERTYHVKVHGVKFELRKINPIDYMTGSKAVVQVYQTYKVGGSEKELDDPSLATLNKMKEHYIDVFMASIVNPQLRREKLSKDGKAMEGIWVYHLLTDWALSNDLYAKILEISYGKKKLKYLLSQKKN
jgi:hypothetical protein